MTTTTTKQNVEGFGMIDTLAYIAMIVYVINVREGTAAIFIAIFEITAYYVGQMVILEGLTTWKTKNAAQKRTFLGFIVLMVLMALPDIGFSLLSSVVGLILTVSPKVHNVLNRLTDELFNGVIIMLYVLLLVITVIFSLSVFAFIGAFIITDVWNANYVNAWVISFLIGWILLLISLKSTKESHKIADKP